MIDPKELRLGNWVKDKFDNQTQITLDSFTMISDQEMVYFPIPLTGRLFIKSEFTGENNRFFHSNLPNISFSESDEGYKILDSTGKKISTIRYIHTLQNLYFSLSGKELVIDM